MRTAGDCRPFIKWAGGKTQLLDKLKAKMPLEYGRYFEPMVGGGALFFAIKPAEAFLSDENEELINAYQVVRDNVEMLIERLTPLQRTKEQFVLMRSGWNIAPDCYENVLDYQVARAARFIYLNKTCFNGLYRVNSKGNFNVPMGSSTAKILDIENLRACSQLLAGKFLSSTPFQNIEHRLNEAGHFRANDFVYFDPPYIPLNETSKFTEYTANGFSLRQHEQLRDLCQRISDIGVKFMLSNADTPRSRELYSAFNIEAISARRSISAKNSGRKMVGEIIVTNY